MSISDLGDTCAFRRRQSCQCSRMPSGRIGWSHFSIGYSRGWRRDLYAADATKRGIRAVGLRVRLHRWHHYPPRLISHRATPVKVVRAPRGSTFPGGRFPLVAALLGASARDSACRGKPGAVAPPISRKGSGKAHGSRRPPNHEDL